ncbi:MAG: hypothetical protein BWY29_00814 [Microgenomates group bacterium ADurb.Bin238]|jgi:hypothetical protein|nr:MAG: hypothetical protein BWY29_00814 [Microgenomates group bacterium ADurb.Bin238]
MNIIKPVYAQTSDIDSQVTGFFAYSNVGDLVSTLVTTAIVVGALATLIYLIMGGINWIISAGDTQKVESAQKHITNALIGLVILVAAYAIFTVVKTFLGIGDEI